MLILPPKSTADRKKDTPKRRKNSRFLVQSGTSPWEVLVFATTEHTLFDFATSDAMNQI